MRRITGLMDSLGEKAMRERQSRILERWILLDAFASNTGILETGLFVKNFNCDSTETIHAESWRQLVLDNQVSLLKLCLLSHLQTSWTTQHTRHAKEQTDQKEKLPVKMHEDRSSVKEWSFFREFNVCHLNTHVNDNYSFWGYYTCH